MKNNSICDDILVEAIAKELVKIGLLVPISEIEQRAVRIYDDITKAHSLVDGIATIDCNNKDERYYAVLTNLLCADIIAETRLSKASDGYEATSILSLLQKYLDNLSKVAKTERRMSPIVFAEIISKLPIELTIAGDDNGWYVKSVRVKEEKSHETTPMAKEPGRYSNYTGNPITKERPKTDQQQPRICSTCSQCSSGNCDGCRVCNDTDCAAMVTISVSYLGECFGFPVDPGVIGLEIEAMDQRQFDASSGALKHSILRAARVLSKRSKEILNVFREAYCNSEKD